MIKTRIVDEDSLLRWASRRKITDIQLVAFRATMRVLPLYAYSAYRSIKDWQTYFFGLPIYWCMIIASLDIKEARRKASSRAAEWCDEYAELFENYPDIKNLATSSAFLAHSIKSNDKSFAVSAVAFSIDAIGDLYERKHDDVNRRNQRRVWSQVEEDCRNIIQGNGIASLPLWSRGEDSILYFAEEQFFRAAKEEPEILGFWFRWWQLVYRGRSLDREFHRRVASIPYKDWEKNDPAHIAALIRDIEEVWSTETLAEKRIDELAAETPDDEEIVRDEKSGKLVSIPRPAIPDDLLASILERLSTATRRLRRDLKSNPTDNAGQILIGRLGVPLTDLKADLRKYAGRPLDTHDAIDQCKAAIIGHLADCGMADDWRMQRFVGLLDTCLSDIRRNDSNVLDIVQKREDDKFARMGAENQRLYLELCAEMAKDSAGFLRKTMLAQIDLSLDESADPDERKAARYALRARLPRGAKAIQNLNNEHAELSATRSARVAGKSGIDAKATVKTAVSVLDGAHKVEAGGKAIGGWATRVYSEAASGNFFGLREWLSSGP